MHEEYLKRIAEALERAYPNPPGSSFFTKADAFIWKPELNNFEIIKKISSVKLSILQGMDEEKEKVLNNTSALVDNRFANNILLWGARGMGKSTLIKSVFNEVNKSFKKLKIIEVSRDSILELDKLFSVLREIDFKFIIFCDDISFDDGENSYKSLKSILDGGLKGDAKNVVVYATSNRRHLLSRKTDGDLGFIRESEENDEKLSISDRFGISIGLYECDQRLFLEIINRYAQALGLTLEKEVLEKKAIAWQMQRGARSGRVAKQFIISLSNELNLDQELINNIFS